MIRIAKAIYARIARVVVSRMFGNVALARWLGVTVGTDCRLYVRDFGSEPFLISIGDRVAVAQGCIFVTHDGTMWLVRDSDGFRYHRFGRITIGSDVFIGANCTILPGVTIGDRVIIGAGSVVTKNVPNDSVIAGNPARHLRDFPAWREWVQRTGVSERDLPRGPLRARVERAMEIEKDRMSK